jgi:2-keto-4-pentenoate hydratase/2-oxohepta-3-ene-1,7-dioic acid hydratase in catechol pathway
MRHARVRDEAGYVRQGEWTNGTTRAGGRTYDADEVDVLPPVDPSKVVCVGANYRKHIDGGGSEVPDRPLLFLTPPNAVAGHGDDVTLPTPGVDPEDVDDDGSGDIDIGDGRIDYEAELGVVIGEQARNVAAADADDVVAGYTCVDDVSNRDDQQVEASWVRGKALDDAAPMGPVVADPEHVPADPRVRLRLNGERRQDSDEDELVFSVPEVVAEVTRFLTLEPGDVVTMGTPAGVGPLSDGDTVEVEVEGVGTLEHTVRAPEQ